MKTLVIYHSEDIAKSCWFIVEGDWSKFHGTEIGEAGTDEEVKTEEELMELLYKNPDENFELKHVTHQEQPPLEGYDCIALISNIY